MHEAETALLFVADPVFNFNPASRVSDLKVWVRSVSHTLPAGKTKNGLSRNPSIILCNYAPTKRPMAQSKHM